VFYGRFVFNQERENKFYVNSGNRNVAKVTRGEFAAILYRLIKLSIDPSTAQGWTVNDDEDGVMISVK